MLAPDGAFQVTAGLRQAIQGEYKITLNAGQSSYNGGFTLSPPADSDVDLTGLNVQAVLFDPTSNTSETDDDGFDVIVDAVADTPILNVPDDRVKHGLARDGYKVDLDGTISAAVADLDGSETLTKIVIEIPNHPGYIGLNKGTEVSPRVWELSTSDLNDLELLLDNSVDKHDIKGTTYIKVTAYAEETNLSGQEKDYSDNIATVTKYIELYIVTSPLVMDLDGDGIELVAIEDGSRFDIDADGVVEQTGWVAADDGLLALDINKDGLINDGSELFGDIETDGFTILAGYDGNADGIIDAQDAVWSDLLVWQDVNQDGVSQDTELYTLDALGIASIDLNATDVDYEIEGSIISDVSTFTYTDGSTGEIVDAWFQQQDADEVGVGVEVAGTSANDTIFGTDNADTLVSSAGNDELYGGGGADVFLFTSIGEGLDTIKDFNALEGDVVDLSAILQDFDSVQDSINDFVFQTESNDNTVISVDVNGSGDAAQAVEVVVLEGATGLEIEDITKVAVV